MAALPSPSATTIVSISQQKYAFTLKNNSRISIINLATKPRCTKCVIVRSSSETSPAPAPETTSETESESEESAVEVPKGPPSLISTLNVERALRGIPITDVDPYGTLGIPKGCSYDQVNAAYKKRVEQVMIRGFDEEQLTKQLGLLKESYLILSNREERRLYDWSLVRSEKPERYAWPFEVDITQAPIESPPPQEPEDVEPTRLVGYFVLGWLLLAFTLSIILNT